MENGKLPSIKSDPSRAGSHGFCTWVLLLLYDGSVTTLNVRGTFFDQSYF